MCPSSIVLNDVLDRADSTGREELYSADDMEQHRNVIKSSPGCPILPSQLRKSLFISAAG